VRAWGLELWARNTGEYSNALTAVLMPQGHDERELRRVILEKFDMSLGSGLGKISGKVFRIGHLGHFNDLMLCGTLAGVEMGLTAANVPHQAGGVQSAMNYLANAKSADVASAAAPRPAMSSIFSRLTKPPSTRYSSGARPVRRFSPTSIASSASSRASQNVR